MSLRRETHPYRSIFAPSTPQEQQQNFDLYWSFCQSQAGELLEAERDLTRKRDIRHAFQAHPVRARQPLPDPDVFYRNCVRCQDPVATIDRKTLLLLAIYKVARHEWVGITGAWDATSPFCDARHVITKICRYHLAEEFGHIRLFHEMFLTCHLDRVTWVPLSPLMQRVYRIFPHLPGALMDPLAFVTELMGLMFYCAVDTVLDDVFGDEPEAGQRIREILHEITVDELAHIGQRRNFLSPRGVQIAQWLVRPMFHAFFRGIPESRCLFDIDQMIRDAAAFDYNHMAPTLLQRSWVPTYCRPALREARSAKAEAVHSPVLKL
jgi:hypothetical protein